MIKEVDDEGYKYLGIILELDKFKEREWKTYFEQST